MFVDVTRGQTRADIAFQGIRHRQQAIVNLPDPFRGPAQTKRAGLVHNITTGRSQEIHTDQIAFRKEPFAGALAVARPHPVPAGGRSRIG